MPRFVSKVRLEVVTKRFVLLEERPPSEIILNRALSPCSCSKNLIRSKFILFADVELDHIVDNFFDKWSHWCRVRVQLINKRLK
jgi:hypothetical protein